MIRYEPASDGVVVIRLDSPPLNAITGSDLAELHEAVRRADEDPDVRSVVLTGREDHFSAGADIGLFREIRTAENALRLSARFQAVFQDIESLSKPVVAALAGRVMGGALELAIACHARVFVYDTTFSMPEVNLGILPGAGGTQRLPRLIGLGPALEMMLTAKPVSSAQARELGLVDAVCAAGELVAAARRLLASTDVLWRTSELADNIGQPQTVEAGLQAARNPAEPARPELLGPRLILDAVRIGLTESFQAGLKAEREAFARCAVSPAAQNKLYLFFATRSTAKAPRLKGVEPLPVKTVGVIGAGTMGTGIAQAFAQAGLRVLVRDQQPDAVEKALERIRQSVQKRRDQGKLSEDQADAIVERVTPDDDATPFAEADLVIEAVFEDVDVKSRVLQQVEAVCRPEAIVATNTSTISLDDLAGVLERPERLVGLHFFNPAHRMPLVEIIHREGTAPPALATAVAVAKRLRKTPVLVKNREGFLVNRVFLPYRKEAFWLLEEGADARAVDRAAVDFGFPMRPLALGMAGLDILEATDRVLRRAFPWHGPGSALVERLVAAGCLGQKSGAGVYKYQSGDYTPHDHSVTADLLREVRQQRSRPVRSIEAAEITDRLVLRMVAEAFRVLEEAVVERESDLDVAVVLGVAFPDFRGGVIRYARDRGLADVVQRLETLAERHGERFAPTVLLRQLAQRGLGSRLT